jgi:hypothetical protein
MLGFARAAALLGCAEEPRATFTLGEEINRVERVYIFRSKQIHSKMR